jgi:hypothetical protein
MAKTRWLLILAISVMGSLLTIGVANAQSGAPAPFPSAYGGAVTSNGVAVPDGMVITAKIDDWESEPAYIVGGRYESLIIAPDSSALVGKTITFHLQGIETANETDKYVQLYVNFSFDLTFSNVPVPTPTPTNTPGPPTPTPVTAYPSIYSGTVVIPGYNVLDGNKIVARLGTFESFAVGTIDGQFTNLVVDPGDISFVGQTVEFFLNGVKSDTTLVYESGKVRRDIILIFSAFPTPVAPIPTETPVEPTPTLTPTAVPPVNTPTVQIQQTIVPTVIPTPVVIVVTATSVSIPVLGVPTATPTAIPTVTPEPTATVVPSNTPEPTATVTPLKVEPTEIAEATPVPENNGDCNLPFGPTSTEHKAVNLMLLFAPLVLLVGYRYKRKRNGGSS